MATQTKKTATTDAQNLLDLQGYQDVLKTIANMNERMASITIQAGTRATDVSSEAAKEAFANVRDLTGVRDEPAEYGKAFTEFAQKQTELFTRTVQAFATDMQKASSETSDLASKAGEEITTKVTKSAESAAQKVKTAASKAA
ncbi:phasin family protein [Roseovarius sp. E0-M6]|uniref:phasin family protein n=1 Tax=Roseovarius sp. E0-M6 TaxID=3127118 RepID=UPI0030104877